MSRFLFCESSSNLGGQELQILLQMAALRRAGHGVLLACPEGSGIAREAASRALEWRPVAFRASLDPSSIAALRRLIAVRRIEVAFCHSGHDAGVLSLAARLVSHRPLLIRVRTYQPGVPKAFPYNRLVDRTLVHSEYMRKRVLRNPAIRAERVDVLHPLLPLEDFRVLAASALPAALAGRLAGRRPVIVHPAMLRPEKGHRVALEAIARLKRRHAGLLYVIAGAGPEEPALRQLAAGLGVEQAVLFAGLVMPVYPLLARADLVVMPSLEEPLGQSQIEALALGIPVVVSDAGGLPETVTHGETGWIARAGDIEAWCGMIDEALADPARARAMAQRGREFVERTFGPEAFLAGLEHQLALARA
ncbi:MAG TPA: glycosyltransferase [Burkholderiales bacterium]|nr:glycosyltransferase [Burkholderiales bacterium]